MPAACQTIDDGRSTPITQNVEEGQSGPRKSDDIDLGIVSQAVTKDASDMDADSVVPGDFVAKSNDQRPCAGCVEAVLTP